MALRVGWFAVAGVLCLQSARVFGDVSVSAGAVLGHFDYEERSDSGAVFNSERGAVPGVQASLDWAMGNGAGLALSGTGFAGEVRYRGQTQAGAPLKTRSDFTLTLVDITASLPALVFDTLQFTPMVRAGVREWQRDILPTERTRSLSEVYRWHEIGLGSSVCLATDGKWPDAWCAEGWALYTFEGQVEVDLAQAGAGKPSLRLGARPGARVSVSAEFGRLEAGLLGHFWQFGKSQPETVNRPFGRLTIEEPASRSWLTGLWVAFSF